MGVSMVSDSSFEQDAIPSLKDTFVNLFPSNPIEAMAEGNMIQIIIFAMLFGLWCKQNFKRDF